MPRSGQEFLAAKRAKATCKLAVRDKERKSRDSCLTRFVVIRGVYSDTTQLNSTDPVEQRTANQREASQSCFCL